MKIRNHVLENIYVLNITFQDVAVQSSYLYALAEKKRGVKPKDIPLRSHTSTLDIDR